jgi:hypothetical protein
LPADLGEDEVAVGRRGEGCDFRLELLEGSDFDVDLGARARVEQLVVLVKTGLGALGRIELEDDLLEVAVGKLGEIGVAGLGEAAGGKGEGKGEAKRVHLLAVYRGP